jgi:hypothetical protein
MVCRDIGASDPEFSCTSEVEKYVLKVLGNDPTIKVRQMETSHFFQTA